MSIETLNRSTDGGGNRPAVRFDGRTALGNRPAFGQNCRMAIFFIFILGVANFALHRAVIESGHPMLAQVPWFATERGRKIALAMEFLVLLAAMLLVANGWPNLAWGYLFYSMLNGISGWLILKGRV